MPLVNPHTVHQPARVHAFTIVTGGLKHFPPRRFTPDSLLSIVQWASALSQNHSVVAVHFINTIWYSTRWLKGVCLGARLSDPLVVKNYQNPYYYRKIVASTCVCVSYTLCIGSQLPGCDSALWVGKGGDNRYPLYRARLLD